VEEARKRAEEEEATTALRNAERQKRAGLEKRMSDESRASREWRKAANEEQQVMGQCKLAEPLGKGEAVSGKRKFT
jgi:hypothetical protein